MREWDLMSREKLLQYAEKNNIPVEMKHKKGGSPYSMDANLLHISYEGRHLENPGAEPEEDMWRWTVSLKKLQMNLKLSRLNSKKVIQ